MKYTDKIQSLKGQCQQADIRLTVIHAFACIQINKHVDRQTKYCFT